MYTAEQQTSAGDLRPPMLSTASAAQNSVREALIGPTCQSRS